MKFKLAAALFALLYINISYAESMRVLDGYWEIHYPEMGYYYFNHDKEALFRIYSDAKYKGNTPDKVIFNCNGQVSILKTGQLNECILPPKKTVSIIIHKEDFKHGASGDTYRSES